MSVPRITQPIRNSRPGRNPTASADPRREYVAAGPSATGRDLTGLAWAIDDLTGDLGYDLYDRMLVDPQIAGNGTALKTGVLQEAVELAPAVGEDDPERERAVLIRDFCARTLAQRHLRLRDFLWDMLDAIFFGYKVGEQTYRVAEDWERLPSGALPLVLDRLAVKPRDSLTIVVDTANHVVGFVAARKRMAGRVQSGPAATPAPEDILPRAKFALLTFRPRDADPRGTSILRPAYNAWWLKMQLWQEYNKYMAQFAGPSLLGKLSAEAEPEAELDENGEVVADSQVSPAESMLTELQKFRNGTAMVVANDADVTVISGDQGGTGGDAFLAGFGLLNREITYAMLHQTLATMEGQNMARAASETHGDLLTAIIRVLRGWVEEFIESDILAPLVAYNFGAEAERLIPQASLGRVEQQDMTRWMGAIATLFGAGFFTESQLPALDKMFGIPVRKSGERSMRDTLAASRPAPQGGQNAPADA